MGFLDEKHKKIPLRRKLFIYMITLAVITLAFIATGSFFMGNFSSTKETVSQNLSFQLDVYERQVDRYYDDLAMMGSALSDDLSELTQNYLSANSITLNDVNDSEERVLELQTTVFFKLREELLKTDCSGAFVFFNATVNTGVENAQYSKTGLYFQRSTLDSTDDRLLLYRGIYELGKTNNVMPHRKWRLEFSTDLIPEYNSLPITTLARERQSYLLNVSTLQGTSERAMHFIIPLSSKAGENYGFCGFEISESYFKKYFAQVTQISHLTCLFTKIQTGKIDADAGFSAGVYNGYYLAPKGELKISSFGNGLITLKGSTSYVGKTKTVGICNEEYSLTVIFPKADYDDLARQNTLRITLVITLVLVLTILVCVLFTRKFLSPILKDLDKIRKRNHQNSSSDIAEIDDLFVFLTEQDNLREQENNALLQKQQDALNKAKSEIERLSYLRKSEVDPADYEIFKAGIQSLTKTEKTVFRLYLQGKNAEEIMEICAIQQSTLKYHNHNILGKLGVSSRKEMLRYATLLKQETGEDF